MNFLAHLHLSENDEALMLGNFLGDFVRKSQADLLPERIQLGISLHRFIDEFTDSHPIPQRTKELVRSTFGKYAPVLVDIYFDHFLAANWSDYDDTHLQVFADRAMHVLTSRNDIMPIGAKRFLGYAKAHNILVYYSKIEGIDYVLQGMSRRAKFESKMEKGAAFLEEHYASIQTDFKEFYPQLQAACKAFLGGETTFAPHGK